MDLKKAEIRDRQLIRRLGKKLRSSSRVSRKTPTRIRNKTIARILTKELPDASLSPRLVQELSLKLKKEGTFRLAIEQHPWRDIDGERYVATLLRAAKTDMWPMGTHCWIRDNALVAARLLFYPAYDEHTEEYRRCGLEMLLSALSIMASCSQLERFGKIIQSRSEKFIRTASHWPHIFLGIDTNLSARKTEPWAHQQDAWQILAWYVLEAIEKNIIGVSQLTEKQKEFLALIVPFLARVDYTRSENSGSWEEIPSLRSSVIGWEMKLIHKLGEFALQPGFEFLEKTFERQKRFLGPSYQRRSFHEAVKRLVEEGAGVLAKNLPFESPGYSKKDLRYRKADGTLIYLLHLDIPEFIGKILGKKAAWVHALEKKLLAEIISLRDPRTRMIRRYHQDSYQRQGFFRNVSVAKLNALYGAPSGDASSHFGGRLALFPSGPEAAWCHFVWQLSSWAGRKYHETGKVFYRKQQEKYFLDGLNSITGANEYSLEVGSDGKSRIIRIPAFRIPECYITDMDDAGNELIFPSPHTPLNWAVGEAIYAFGWMRRS